MSKQGDVAKETDLGRNFALIALLKTLHEQGHDSWSAFSELALAVIEDGQNLEEFSRKFYVTYKMDLPDSVIYTVLARLKRDRLIQYKERIGPYHLTEPGKQNANKVISSADIFKREFDLLIKDLRSYLNTKSIKIQSVEKEFIKFIDDNLAFTTNIISGSKAQNRYSKNQIEIASYISNLEGRNGTIFKILQNIFFGRLYLEIFNHRAPIDKAAKFDKLEIFLDTNVVLVLLGLQDRSQKKSLLALIKALQDDKNIEVKVLDVTITELTRTLLFASSKGNLLKDYRVDSLAWRLKELGYDSVAVAALVEDLPDKLKQMGIAEETVYNEASDSNCRLIQDLSDQYNQGKSQNAIEHDASALTQIDELRRGSHTGLLEKSKAIFLTTDHALIASSKELSQKDSSFPRCISAVELTCLTWLKNMGKEELMQASLRQALMAYAREKMLQSDLWDGFVDRLKEAQQRGTVSDKEVALIISSEQTKSLLFEQGTTALDQIFDEGYIKQLKKEQKNILDARANSKRSITRIENKKKKISRSIAAGLYFVFSLVITSLAILTILWLLRRNKLGDTANLLALVPLIFIVLALNFGRIIRLEHLVQLREKLIVYIAKKVEMILSKLFY